MWYKESKIINEQTNLRFFIVGRPYNYKSGVPFV